VEIRVEEGVPGRLGEVEKRSAREDGGVVHEDVDRAERALGIGHEAPRLLGLGDVSADRRGLAAEGDDLRRRRLGGRLVVQVIERHVGPGLGESDRDGAPDTALGARDKHDLSCAPPVGGHDERCITSRHPGAKPWRRTNGPKWWRSGTEYWRALSSDQPYGSV